MSNAITPVGKNLVVVPIVEQKSQYIMTSPDSPQKGRVTAIGAKVSKHIVPGCIVSFARYIGTEVMDGETLNLIIQEKDILAFQN